jgi:CheY-like chemotaxis protein
VRRTLASTFGKAGYRVATADSGEAAIAWVQEHGMPPLITLDMEMPGMNGLETLRALHEMRSERPVQAMFVTSKNHERVRGIAEPLGAIAFFSKPYADDALLAAAQGAAPLPAAV